MRVSESSQIPNSPTAQEMLAAVWAWASSSSLRPKASLVSSVQQQGNNISISFMAWLQNTA